MGRPTSALLLAALLASPLLADVIHLKNGERLDGKVVAETEDELKVELQKKGMTLTVNVKRADVERIESSRELEERREEFGRRRKEAASLPAGFKRVVALFDLGLWARDGDLYPEAIQAFHEAQETLPEFEDVAELEVARTHLVARDFDACMKALDALFTRNPNHEQAKILARELADSVQVDVEDDTEKGFEYFRAGNIRRALGIFINFVEKHPRAEVDVLSKKCEETMGRSLAAIMVECRFRQGCPEAGCKGGWKKCPRPTCDRGRKVTYLKPGEGRQQVKEAYCGTCKGIRYLLCEKCLGTGFYFGRPTDYEKEEFTQILVERARKMVDQALGVAQQAAEAHEETEPQRPEDAMADRTRLGASATPSKVDPMTVLARACRARRFLKSSLELSPEKTFKEFQDVPAEIEALDDMTFETSRAAAGEYIKVAEQCYYQAVGPEGGITLDPNLLQTRIDRAFDGMELAEQARMYLTYALKNTSDSPSIHLFDAQRQLESATRVAERCRLAYQRMQNIQDHINDLANDPDQQRLYYKQAREDLSRLLEELKSIRDEVR